MKLCLHLSYIAQNSFHFDEIFHRKLKIPILVCVTLRRHLVAILGIFAVLKLIFPYSILTFPTIPSFYHETMDALKSTGKTLNLALTLRSLSENSNLITPLSMSNETFPLRNGMETRSFPSLNYNPQLHYNSSAVLSLAFDAMTLPWRMLKGPYASPSQVAAGLSAYGRKFASLQLVAPFAKPFKDKLNPYLQVIFNFFT